MTECFYFLSEINIFEITLMIINFIHCTMSFEITEILALLFVGIILNIILARFVMKKPKYRVLGMVTLFLVDMIFTPVIALMMVSVNPF